MDTTPHVDRFCGLVEAEQIVHVSCRRWKRDHPTEPRVPNAFVNELITKLRAAAEEPFGQMTTESLVALGRASSWACHDCPRNDVDPNPFEEEPADMPPVLPFAQP